MAKERFMNPQEMSNAMSEFFKKSEGTKKFPSIASMLMFLQISEDEFSEYLEGKHKYSEQYRKLSDMALLKRKDWLYQKMIDDPKATSACIHLLKQPENGGEDPEIARRKGTKIIHKVDELQGEDLGELFG